MKTVHNINDIAGKMSAIDRYSQTRLVNPESVLEHTGYVGLCSLMIADELISAGEPLNTDVVLMGAILHDVEEIITGDIASPTKYSSKEVTEGIQKLECESAKKILSERLYQKWLFAKTGREGFIVALADKLAVVYKIHQETECYGNNTLRGHIEGTIPALLNLGDRVRRETFKQLSEEILFNIINDGVKICQEIQKSI